MGITFCCKKGKCNMNETEKSSAFRQLEGTIRLQIEEITEQIRELMAHRQSLERVLLKARQQDELVNRVDVTRKNSINRVLVEGAILQTIEGAKKPVRAKNLYQHARGLVPDLRENTFRSYLFRMKTRGLLTRAGAGTWQLAQKVA
jgi:hypothetical protein